MKKKFKYLLILFVSFSCNQAEENNTHNVEIYLTNKRIESYQGVKLEKSKIDSLKIVALQNSFGKDIRFDTLKSEIIFAGAFTAKKQDLRKKPFIKSNQIKVFNKSNGDLVLDSIAEKSINELNHDSFGNQFVLTIDKKPEIFGYFYPISISSWNHCSTYHYIFPKGKTNKYTLYKGHELKSVDIKKEFPDMLKLLSEK